MGYLEVVRRGVITGVAKRGEEAIVAPGRGDWQARVGRFCVAAE